AGGAGRPRQLRRRAALDAARPPARPAAGVRRQPAPARPRRAAVQEAAAQAVRPDDQAAGRAAGEAQENAWGAKCDEIPEKELILMPLTTAPINPNISNAMLIPLCL